MPMPIARGALALLILAGSTVAVQAAESGDVPRPLDDFSVWLGGFHARSNTTVTAAGEFEGQSGSGSVNLERDLGLDQGPLTTHARLDFLVAQSHGISMEYYGYQRINSVQLARTIEFNGDVYQAGARLRGEFDYDFGSVAYRRWFGEGSTVWGLGLGAAYYRVQTLLDGELTLDDDSVASRTGSSDAAIAPLLALGWRHAYSDQLRVYADLSGVAKGGRLSGHIMEAAVGLEWFPFRRVGLALEYGATDIRLDRKRDLLDARLDLALHGPSLFLRVR